MLRDVEFEILQGELDVDVRDIVYHSKNARHGSLFVCIEGAAKDGHDFAKEAVEKGAVVIVCSKPLSFKEDITVLQAEDCRMTLAKLATQFYHEPARELKVIGVTGTKGKTSTTYMLKQILEKASIKTGLIGTVEIDTGCRILQSRQTTPESLEIQSFFREMAQSGCEAVVMEVSSQALKQHRVHGICFDIAILTNLQEDHISPHEHKDFDEYVECKSKLFSQCKLGIINGDDVVGKQFIRLCPHAQTYGFESENDLILEKFDYVRIPGKFAMEFQAKGMYNINLVVGAAGKFSVFNALAATMAAKVLCVEDDCIEAGLKSYIAPGRQEIFSLGYDKNVLVDYAHNGMALASLLSELRCYNPTKITCVFGCGGERDRNRRFKMGEAAAKFADFSIITSDNPRNESPIDIINDIISRIRAFGGNYCVIEDRREAIEYAVNQCETGELVVIAGKGHENYQIIGNCKIHFDDREEVRKSIEKVNNGKNYNRRN